MSCCTLPNSLPPIEGCEYSLPGGVDVYVLPYCVKPMWSFIGLGSAGTVDVDWLDQEAPLDNFKFQKIPNLDPNSIQYQDSLVVQGVSRYRRHTLQFTFQPYSHDHELAKALSIGRWIVLVKKSNGTFVLLGPSLGLRAIDDGASLNSGVVEGDEAGWTINLQALESYNIQEASVSESYLKE